MRSIPQAAVNLVKEQESCVLTAYQDPSGILTAGYGHTGADIRPGDPISQQQADAWLASDLEIAATRLCKIIDGVVIDLTDNQYSALIDFVFNLGADPKWTIWKRLNARQYDQIPLEMAKFVNANGKKLQGLVNRRNAEIALWATGEPGTDAETLSSSTTRTTVTPPTPADPVPATKSKGIIGGIVATVTGVPPAVDGITRSISGYASQSHYVQHAMVILATVSAGCMAFGTAYFIISKLNARN